MSFKFLAAWFSILLAIPSVSSAQKDAPESVRTNTGATHQQYALDWDAEERQYLQALDVATKASNDQRLVYSLCMGLASRYEARHRYTDAEKHYEGAYNAARTVFGNESEEVAKALNHLGEMRLDQGQIPQADRSFHEALKILESNKDANRIAIAAVLNNVAAVQHMTGNLSRAAAVMRKAIRIFEIDPSATAEDIGTALSNLATLLQEMERLPEAMTMAQRAVSILERCNSDHFAVSLVTLARLHLDEGDSARAEATLQRALRSIEKLSKEDSPTQALIFGHLGVLYGRTGRHRDAESYFQRAIEINRRLLGLEHPRLLDSMDAYANLLRATKRKGEAKKLEMHVREQREKYRRQNPAAASVVDVSSIMRQRDQ